MNGLEDSSMISSENGLAGAECDATRFSQADYPENENLFESADGGSSSATEAEPMEAFSNDELQDNDENMTSTSRSASSASSDEADHPMYSFKVVGGADRIDFFPDFIVFNDIYSKDSAVIFSDSVVEAKGFNSCIDGDNFEIQLRIDDIVSIESIWIARMVAAIVKIHVIAEGSVEAQSDARIPDIKELKFAVTDSCWIEKREAIVSLNARYDAVWTSVIDTEIDEYSNMHFPDSYFPSFSPFEDFIYPPGDADAVSISKRDVDLLGPDTFVNDTIIDFYIKYLKDRMPPDRRHRYHFFNSFFFRKLGDLEKYPSNSFDGRAAFLRVRKWTRKVNLFEKDFIFVPVNNNYHWSLIVICHPGEISSLKDENIGKMAKIPCILHMDSIRGTHMELEGRLRSYLWEEWKERHKESSEDIAFKFSNMRFISLELPQQQNSYDCGLFLLHYVELFLDEDPVGINAFKITKLTKFLNADWFPAAEPSLKRRAIQHLIHSLLENHSQEESSPAIASDKVLASSNHKPENAMEFLSESFGLPKSCNGDLTCCRAENRVETAALGKSHCSNRSGISVGDPYASIHPTQSTIEVPYQTFDRMSSFNEFDSAIASLQEACGPFEYAEPTDNGFHISGKVKTEAHDVLSTSRQYLTEVSWSQQTCAGPVSCENLDSMAMVSICNDNSLERHEDETCEINRGMVVDEGLEHTKYASGGNDACLPRSFRIHGDETCQNAPGFVIDEGLKQTNYTSGENDACLPVPCGIYGDEACQISTGFLVNEGLEKRKCTSGEKDACSPDSFEMQGDKTCQISTGVVVDKGLEQTKYASGENDACLPGSFQIHGDETSQISTGVVADEGMKQTKHLGENDACLPDSFEVHGDETCQITTEVVADERLEQTKHTSGENDACLPDSFEVHGDETCQITKIVVDEGLEQAKCTSGETDSCLPVSCASAFIEIAAVAESDNSTQDPPQNDNQNLPSEACAKNIFEDSHGSNSTGSNGRRRGPNCDGSYYSVLDLDAHRAAKRQRLTSPSEECPKGLQEDQS